MLAISDGRIVVQPALALQTQGKGGKTNKKEEKQREKEEKQREKDREKEEKQREKEEKQREKEREKEEKQREKDREKEEKQREKDEKKEKRMSTIKASTNRKSSIDSNDTGAPSFATTGSENLAGFLPSLSSLLTCLTPSFFFVLFTALARNPDISKVYYKGYLNKKTEQLAVGNVPNRRWFTYWAVLRGHYLLFYGERKQYTNDKKPVGGLNIHGATITPIYDHHKREHVFRVFTVSQASYLLEAETLEDLTAWMNYLEQCSKLAIDDGTFHALCLPFAICFLTDFNTLLFRHHEEQDTQQKKRRSSRF